ncbi:hypothetical protein H2274_07060 [Campylobacter sp. W0049]|uniref:hypothetical protein n=1 Tax=Campylobacter molothri TaxID=1032242 RepID=UPI00301D216D|nr:hypothetical protein [Campylobacter sp. W0049]
MANLQEKLKKEETKRAEDILAFLQVEDGEFPLNDDEKEDFKDYQIDENDPSFRN